MCTRSSQTSFTNIVTMATVTEDSERSLRRLLTGASRTHGTHRRSPDCPLGLQRGTQGLEELKRAVAVTRGRAGNPSPPGPTAADPWALRTDSV